VDYEKQMFSVKLKYRPPGELVDVAQTVNLNRSLVLSYYNRLSENIQDIDTYYL
jgi:hypothetical protein